MNLSGEHVRRLEATTFAEWTHYAYHNAGLKLLHQDRIVALLHHESVSGLRRLECRPKISTATVKVRNQFFCPLQALSDRFCW